MTEGRAGERVAGGPAAAENPPTTTKPPIGDLDSKGSRDSGVSGGAVSGGVRDDGDAAGAKTARSRRRSRGGQAVAGDAGQ